MGLALLGVWLTAVHRVDTFTTPSALPDSLSPRGYRAYLRLTSAPLGSRAGDVALDHVGEGAFHAPEVQQACAEQCDDDDCCSQQGGDWRVALAEQRPAEGFDDACHGIEPEKRSPALWDVAS
jgi:hypothetical protein